MKPDAADNSVPREISALLSNQRLILRETQRAVTPLGGVAVFVAFLHKLGLVEKLRQHMPIHYADPEAMPSEPPAPPQSAPPPPSGRAFQLPLF